MGRRDRPAEAGTTESRVLGWAYVAVGTVALFTAAVPFSATAPTALNAALAGAALVLGAALLAAGPRTPAGVRHGALALATAAVTVCLLASTTPVGRVVTSYGYVWVATYSAWFHTRRRVAVHVGLVATGLGLGLWLTGAPSPLQTWTFVMATVAGVAAALHLLVDRLRQLADRDGLTGLLNRRAFEAAARTALAVAARSGEPVTLAIIDLDDFKLVNDRWGHAAGDALLRQLTHAWGQALRPGDVLARCGGDEFALVMPGADDAAAGRVLDRVRAATEEGRWSVGTATWQGESLDRWMARADRALYEQKEAHVGRARPGPEGAAHHAA